ncbi:MAG TPA: sugar phosphate isomerase/epimerase [Beijerinckiaceae bacterium]|nr:sugar phosphate isomerase/epimerase [Beijerinckiaceae bacterium]
MTAARFPLALHTWTLDTTPLEGALAAARAGGFDAVELRRTDFDRCFERGLSNGAVLDLIRAAGMPVSTLGVEYGWLFARGDESRRLYAVFRDSCANAVALGCTMMMSAPGQVAGALSEAVANLRVASDIVGEHGLRLAIEFNSQHDVINHVDVLHELIDKADRSNCGLLLDAYHLHRSGSAGRGFVEVPGDKIFAFQYSDVAETPVTGVRRPTDRLPPGHGRVEWTAVFQLLAEKGYAGHLSYEAPNPALWERPPDEVAREAVVATKRLLAAAFRQA